jgi:hypothetical protein
MTIWQNLVRLWSWGQARYDSLLNLILFRLVAPLVSPGVVMSYQVQDAWFPSHLLLVGTGRI